MDRMQCSPFVETMDEERTRTACFNNTNEVHEQGLEKPNLVLVQHIHGKCREDVETC